MASLLVMVSTWLVWSATLADRAKSAVNKVRRTSAAPKEPTATMDNIEGGSTNPEHPKANAAVTAASGAPGAVASAPSKGSWLARTFAWRKASTLNDASAVNAAAAHHDKPAAEPAAAEAARRPSIASMWACLTTTAKAVPAPSPARGSAAAPASAKSIHAFAFFRRSQQAPKLSAEATLEGAAEATTAPPTATAPSSAAAKLADGIKRVFTRSARVPSDNAAEAATPASDAPSCGDSTDGGCLTAATPAEATCTIAVAVAAAAPSATSCTSSVKGSKAAAPTPRSPNDFKRLVNRMAKAASPAAAAAPAPGPSKLGRFAIKCREGGAKALRRISSRGASPDQRALGGGGAVPVA